MMKMNTFTCKFIVLVEQYGNVVGCRVCYLGLTFVINISAY